VIHPALLAAMDRSDGIESGSIGGVVP
jgi:hypothetical protein